MASTFSPSLKIELIGDGEQSGIWGQTTNNNLGTLLEQAITGVVNIPMANADYLLSNFNGVSDESRNAVLVVGGTCNATYSVVAPLAEKLYTVVNNTAGGFPILIRASSGANVSIPNGATIPVYCNGTGFFSAALTATTGNITVNGNAIVTGNVATNQNITAGKTLSGTYSQSGTAVTVTAISHGLVVGNSILVDITSGTGVDGTYTVATVTGTDTFTYTAGTVLTTSGNITVNAIGNLTAYGNSAVTGNSTVTGNVSALNITASSNVSAANVLASGDVNAATFTGNGAAISSINASNISSGTIDNARTTAASANGASTIVLRDANGSFAGNVGTFTTIAGNGVALTAINASNISSGTIANDRTTASSSNGASTIVARDTNGSFSANVGTFVTLSGNGVALTAINASNISSGTIANARTTATSLSTGSTIILRDSNGSFNANSGSFSGSLGCQGSAILAQNSAASSKVIIGPTPSVSNVIVDVKASVSTLGIEFYDTSSNAERGFIGTGGAWKGSPGGDFVFAALSSGDIVFGSDTTEKMRIRNSGGVSGTLSVNTAVSVTGINVASGIIPSWAKKVTVMLSDVSSNGTAFYLLQLATTSSIVNTGYLGSGGAIVNAAATGVANFTTGFGIRTSASAGARVSGTIELSFLTGTTWNASGVLSDTNGGRVMMTAGTVDIGAALYYVNLTTFNGIDAFDGGTLNVIYQG
jgi:hypothetical protein